MTSEVFQDLKEALLTLTLEEGLKCIDKTFIGGKKFSSSLGFEDQVLTHFISNLDLDIDIFTIDTGRLFQETYDLLDLTQKEYGVSIKTYFPKSSGVEAMVSQKGPNSFYDSVANRKECCHIRKVEPLSRALAGATVWISGLRAGQSTNRNKMEMVEWDHQYQVVKYNPLLYWTKDEIQAFIDLHNIPVNCLHESGFPSIGCAPCTRAILPGEDERAGRWWWEGSSKECGLHEKANIYGR